MMIQSQILQTLRAPESQARLAHIVAHEALDSRAAVGRRVCAEFGFVDARGSAQLAGCLKALNRLEGAGRIVLPAPRRRGCAPSPRCLDEPVAAATGVPGTVEAVEGLSLAQVEERPQRLLWNTLLHFEHPRGTATFAGCQVRYLVVSAHGVLGAVGFSASALHLRAREAWMGWSAGQRQAHLHRVLCLSRFLIRPGVQCRNLASHVLGRVLHRLPADFEARYRYRPWLVETFVGLAHDGASFKAANFVWVGHTAGRGRQDRAHTRAGTVKSVYMYELEPRWRRQLGLARVAAAPALAPGDGLDSTQWTANEFGGAPLGDKRLSARLVKSAGLLAALPGQALTANAAHDRAAVKGYYRLIDQPAQSEVTPAHILAPHRARTVQRMRGQQTVLCIQDGTDLNFATRPNCEGLGLIGRNQTASKTLGLHLHLTLAVNGEGLPLGVLRCGFDAPPGGGQPPEDAEPRAALAPDKTSKMRRWTDGLRDIEQAAAAVSRKTRVISVMDREADFFELFEEQRRLDRVEVLVRAKHDRCLAKGAPKLFETLRAGAADGHVEIEIDRVSERRKSSRSTRPARTGRVARAEVRHRKLSLPPTRTNAEPAALSAVHVRETDAAARRAGGRVVSAHQPRRRQHRDRGHDHRVLPAALAHRGPVPRAQVRLPRRTSRVPHRRPAPTRTHHQYRDRLAPDGDDPARPRRAGERPPTAVHRHRAAVPERLCRRDRPATPQPPRRRGPPARHPRRLSEPHARPAARPPDHVARLRTNLHRHHRLPHCPEGACRNCPERIVGTGQG